MNRSRRPISHASHLGLIAGVALSYFLAAKLGLSLAFVAEQVTAVWPPTGLSLAAMLLFGRRVWPGIALGAFAANITANEPLGTAIGIAIGNTLEAWVGATLLKRLVGFDNSIERLRDVAGLVLLAAGVSTTVSATIGTSSLCLGGVQPWDAYGPIWLTWWLGDAMGNLVVAPVLLTMATRPRVPEPIDISQALMLTTGLAVVGALAFSERLMSPTRLHSLAYLVFPFVIWGAYRFRQRGTSLVVLLVSTGAILTTIRGHGPFEAETVGMSLALLQIFMGVVAVTALTLGAAIAERHRAEVDKELVRRTGDVLASPLDSGAALPEVARLVSSHWRASCVIVVRDKTGTVEGVSFASNGQASPAPDLAAGSLKIALESSDARAWAATEPTGSHCMVAPLTLQGRVLGAIAVDTLAQNRAFDSGDVRVLADVGQRTAVAIENAGLYSELKKADIRKNEWISMLAHELRNPLSPIRTAAHLLAMPGANHETLAHARNVVERQVQHMVRLIDDLLDVSRIMRGRIELQKAPTDLVAIVTGSIEAAKMAVEAGKHSIKFSGVEEPLWLDADAIRLEQVVTNLLQNAVKFASRPGTIWVKLERDGNDAVLSIRDEGIGIAPEFLPRVFDLFEQAERSLDRSRGGLGIGLTIVRMVVELHGGSVSVRSEGPGKGSEFIVRVPRLETPDTNRKVLPAEIATTHRRILVVDDNADAAETVAAILSLSGHSVRVAHNGADALVAADTFKPEVVVLDIGMPGMSGYAVAQKLRERDTPVRPILIALTGYGQEADRIEADRAGFDKHLTKPVEPDLLLRLIESA